MVEMIGKWAAAASRLLPPGGRKPSRHKLPAWATSARMAAYEREMRAG